MTKDEAKTLAMKARGLVGHATLDMLWDIMLSTTAKRVLEIGSYYGRTSCLIAGFICKQPDGFFITVDNRSPEYVHGQTFGEFANNMMGFGNFAAFNCDSSVAAKQIVGDFDLVFVDGGHSYETVKQDITDWSNRTKVMAFHDYCKDSTKEPSASVTRAINELIATGKWDVIQHAVEEQTIALRRKA